MTKIYNFLNLSGIAETVEMVQEAGGYCKGYVVDIAKKEEVYKAADVIRAEVGDVSSERRGGGALLVRQLKHKKRQGNCRTDKTESPRTCAHIIVC